MLQPPLTTFLKIVITGSHKQVISQLAIGSHKQVVVFCVSLIYKIHVKGRILLISLAVVPMCREPESELLLRAMDVMQVSTNTRWWQQSPAGSPGIVLTKFKH